MLHLLPWTYTLYIPILPIPPITSELLLLHGVHIWGIGYLPYDVSPMT